MIQKRLLSAGLLASVVVVACGGGGQGAGAPVAVSKLTNADNVANFVSGLAFTTNYLLASVQLADSSNSLTCNTGSRAFTEDTSTVNTSDGTIAYASCKSTQDSSDGSATAQLNGKAVSKCTDNAQTADDCNAAQVRFADGPTASTTLDYSAVQTGSAARNLDLKVKGDVAYSEGSDSTVDFNATITVSDSQGPAAGTGIFESLRLVRSQSTNGGYTQSLSGGFGFNGNQPSCALGKVTVRTPTPLTYSNGDSPTAGQITLSDSLGGSARADFNSDGSALVTLANGQTKMYTAAQLAVVCRG